MEQIEDIRLELIERADRFPGGWPAATTFERMAETGDANKTRLDQLWKNACLEVEAKKSVDTSRKAAVRGKLAFQSQRGFQRRNYSFRSVLPSLLSFLCGYLDHFRHGINSVVSRILCFIM